MLFFVQPLFRKSVINCQALWPLHSCRLLIKILFSLSSCRLRQSCSAFAWYSVKIRVIFDVRFERRKVNKKSKPTWKLKHANSILETFEYFCQIPSKSIPTISSYTVSNLGHFLRHSVYSCLQSLPKLRSIDRLEYFFQKCIIFRNFVEFSGSLILLHYWHQVLVFYIPVVATHTSNCDIISLVTVWSPVVKFSRNGPEQRFTTRNCRSTT